MLTDFQTKSHFGAKRFTQLRLGIFASGLSDNRPELAGERRGNLDNYTVMVRFSKDRPWSTSEI